MKSSLCVPASPAAAAAAIAVVARPDRKKNILDSSQRLFARYGYHGVTIRQIASDAKVPLALVGYYFGQKQSLYDAVFAHWSGTHDERRRDLHLALAETAGDAVLRIVTVLISPVVRLRLRPEGGTYTRFLSRGLAQQGIEEDRAIREYFDPLATEFIDALHQALVGEYPEFSRAQAAWGFQFALGAMLHYLSDERVVRLSHGVNASHDPNVEPQLIAFIVHGLRGAAHAFVDPPIMPPQH